MRTFIQEMFFHPKPYHWIAIFLLLPFSFVYGSVMYLRRRFTSLREYDVPIVSVGNLIVGGSGKTPFVIALALRYRDVFVISRGYGRKSRGLEVVSIHGRVVADVYTAGDEAMLMALSLPNASVVVSENRDTAIAFAKDHGARCVILDDGFNRVDIAKFDILLEPCRVENYFTFPAGPFREFFSTRKKADFIAKENETFIRKVKIENITPKMVLVTAISNPLRLEPYLPKGVVHKVYYKDHAYFHEDVLKQFLKAYGATSILCTSKDRVKMHGFKLPISEMKLKLEIEKEFITEIDKYIEGKQNA